MKHSRIAQRVLSLALTGALVLPSLGGISPAMAANGEIKAQLGSTPISLNFKAESDGKWNPEGETPTRVWLNVDDNTAVVDDFSYTVASDKDSTSAVGEKAADRYNVDQYSYLTLKENKLPIEGETLTIEASVDYFDGDDVVWADNVLNDSLNMYTQGNDAKGNVWSYSISNSGSNQVARTGQYGITTGSTGWNAAPKNVDAIPAHKATPVTVTAWYFDPATEEELVYSEQTKPGGSTYKSMEGQLGIYLNGTGEANAATCFMGTAYVSATAPTYNPSNYCLRGGNEGKTYSFGSATRSEGWHKLAWTVGSSETTMTISKLNENGSLTVEGTAASSYITSANGVTGISIANNKGNAGYSEIFVHNKHFLDDISVVKSDATPTTGTVSIQIPVNYTAPKAPVITTQPTDTTVAEGETLTLTVAATDPTGGTPTYQWFKADASDAEGQAVADANADTLTFDGATPGVSYYYCNVTNANGTTKSTAAKVTVLAASSRPATPGGPAVNENGVVNFSYSGNTSMSFLFHFYPEGENESVGSCTKTISLNNSNWASTSILAELRKLEEGSYCVTAQRVGEAGGLNSLESERSTPIVLGKLPTPSAPTWQGYSLTWQAVPNAKSYRVQLYKDGVASGSPISVNAPATSALMTFEAAGSYTGTVTAIADPTTLKFDSVESAKSAAKADDTLNLAFDSAALHKGDIERVILEAPNEYGILNVTYSSNNDKVSVDKNGYLTVADDLAVPVEGIDVTISAEVKYYANTVWANNMESYGRFDCNELSVVSTAKDQGPRLNLTGTSALPDGEAARTGRMGATPYAHNGYGSNVALKAPTTGSVFFWYYDPYTEAEKTASGMLKHGVSLNVHGANDPAATNFAGVGYGDGPSGNLATAQFYSYRTSGTDWKNVSIPRSTGWHKFEFRVTGAGMELYIDDVKARELDSSITEITGLQLCNNWGTQSDAGSYSNGKHFVDDIFVVATDATTTSATKTTTVKVLPKNYAVAPAAVNFDRSYPADLTLTVSPDLADLAAVKLDSETLVAETDYIVAGNAITLKGASLADMTVGEHTITVSMTDTQTISCAVTVTETVSRNYYIDSVNGNDSADGLTPATAWKTLTKLNAAAPFNFGDHIYLEANSVWNGQLILSGDGRPGKEITVTRYTVESGVTKTGADCNTTKRPTINGNGTVGTVPSYIVENAHDGRYKFSGAVELWNSGYWEISWLEVTNLGATSKDGNGRCGIMVMNEWDYVGNTMAQQIDSFYESKKNHVYITDSYVHDVNGLFQDAKDVNNVNGTKHSGGIIGFGYLADFRVERCRISKVDIEGIRSTLFHPQGTQSGAAYPADLETNTIFRNNFIDKLHGDAMVIAGGVNSLMEYNVGTMLGRSYVSKADGSNYDPAQEPVNLNTSKNFAAIWFMGCKDSLAQYNECYDTQYFTPNDGEAWDIDMQSDNCVYQYNYSHHNAGGCILFMNSGCTNNIFRYNLSIEDGGTDYNPHTLFFVVAGGGSPNNYPLVYNNIFTISEKTKALIDGSNRETKYLHFQNNIVLAADGITNRPALYSATYPGTTSGSSNKISGGEFSNNIIWPQSLYDSFATSLNNGVTHENNQVVDPKLIDASRDNVPVLAQEWLAAGKVDEVEGVILSGDNWFDAKVNELLRGYQLTADSPAINAGVQVPYWPGVPVEKRFPLTRDFFGNLIDENDPEWVPSIGIHEFTLVVPDGSSKVTFNSNGGTTAADPSYLIVKNGETVVTLPTAPIRGDYIFDGWNTMADGSGTAFAADTPVVDNIVVYAQWKPLHYAYTVTFDKNGGDTEASPTSKTITEPATSLGSLPTAPGKADFAFAGWNTKADGTGSVFTAKSKISGNVTVYAQWKPIGSYTVTYDKNGGDTEAAPAFQIVVPPATNVGTLPAAPSRSDYTFTGWNTTKTGSGTAFTGSTEVTGNITVYAQWQVYTPAPSPSTPKPKPVEKPAENVTATEGGQVTVKENKDGSSTYTFKPEKEKDILYVRVNGLLVKADSYTAAKGETPSIVVVFGKNGTDHSKDYTDTAALPEYMTEAVNYVVGSRLFQGNGESFVPMGNMNRAMFATVLSRLYGADTTKLTSNFADVAQGSWYEGSVAWISDMGITSGVGGGNFAPEADMTRQELVTLVYRFAQKVGADVSATGALTAFPDGGSVDAWSTDAMSWAVGLGMITGKDGSLAPNDTITRVEAAIILQRMANLLTAKR